MLLKRNSLETLSIGCCAGTVFLIFLHSITCISPITGVWFPIYLVFLFMISLVFSFRFLKWLLSLNRPVKYDLEGLVVRYPFLKYFMGSMLEVYKAGRRKSTQVPYKEYDTNELSVISSVLERKLVSSWYVPYISQEIGFPFACKQLLDQMIGKAFQISHKIETKDVYIGVCLVFATHLREYRKALQRHQKLPSTPVELYYKKSHYMFRDGNKQPSCGDHCIKILRLICKDLVPWELWDTPHSELLIRILSKRLDTFIESTLSNPVWLNDKLVTILLNKNNVDAHNSGSTKETFEADNTINNKEAVTINEETVEAKLTDAIETKLPEKSNSLDSEIQTIPIVYSTRNTEQGIQVNGIDNGKEVEELTNGVEEAVATSSEPVDIQTSPVLRQRRGRQGRNEVKIYDKIIEGSVATWETDVDLRCLSVGQDLLANYPLDGELTWSRLWGHEPEPEGSPNNHPLPPTPSPPQRQSTHQLWFGEEDQLDLELPESPRSPTKKQHSPKSAELLLKDLASSVTTTAVTTAQTAKNKLEGLQDEAAGMMEGLLDFGIAGIRKGLRFTGLSDDHHSQDKDKSPAHHREHPTNNSSPTNTQRTSRNPSEGDAIPEGIDAAMDKLPEENTVLPVLQKQQRIISQDSMGVPVGEGVGTGEGGGGRSPSPQYEEVTDLSATIAKLRSLLNDRSEEVVMWEGAEETRGHTARHHHSRVDTATRADEYDMNADRNSSPNQVANNMQRLDKLLRGTVSGVFNSLRGAVGGDEGEGGAHTHTHTWHYVTHHADTGVPRMVSGLVCRLRGVAPADAALDSLSLPPHPHPPHTPHTPGADHRPTQPSEHLDYDEWLVESGWRVCGAAESCAALGAHHVTHGALTLLLHDLIDPLIRQLLDELACWLRLEIFQQFQHLSQQEGSSTPAPETQHTCREMDLDYTCELIMENVPGILQLLGEATLRDSVQTITSSLSHSEVNRDLVYRLVDVCAMHFSHAATLRNPTFDN